MSVTKIHEAASVSTVTTTHTTKLTLSLWCTCANIQLGKAGRGRLSCRE